jgi:hypothetical protein
VKTLLPCECICTAVVLHVYCMCTACVLHRIKDWCRGPHLPPITHTSLYSPCTCLWPPLSCPLQLLQRFGRPKGGCGGAHPPPVQRSLIVSTILLLFAAVVLSQKAATTAHWTHQRRVWRSTSPTSSSCACRAPCHPGTAGRSRQRLGRHLWDAAAAAAGLQLMPSSAAGAKSAGMCALKEGILPGVWWEVGRGWGSEGQGLFDAALVAAVWSCLAQGPLTTVSALSPHMITGGF